MGRLPTAEARLYPRHINVKYEIFYYNILLKYGQIIKFFGLTTFASLASSN